MAALVPFEQDLLHDDENDLTIVHEQSARPPLGLRNPELPSSAFHRKRYALVSEGPKESKGMSRIAVLFHFNIDPLWARGEILGTSHVVERDGFRVEVRLPSHNEDFPLGSPRDFDRLAIGGQAIETDENPHFAVTIQITQIRIELEADLSPDDFREGADPLARDRAYELFERTYPVARSVATQLSSWLRIEPLQHWLGLSGQQPSLVGPALLWHIDSDTRLHVSWQPPIVITMRDEDAALTLEKLEAIIANLQDGPNEPPLAETVLADAWLLADEAETPLQFTRPVLLAAIACEVKVKRTLRQKVPTVRKELLDVILDNPRDVSIAARDLFHKPCKAALGRSLKDDDAALFKQIDKLFEVRNHIAHRAEMEIDGSTARELIRAASQAFRWLDSVTSPS